MSAALKLSLAALIVAVDQASKFAARLWLSPSEPLAALPVLDWHLHFNSGAAFGVFSDGYPWQGAMLLALSVVICAALLLWLLRHDRMDALNFGLIAIIGGGVGNLIDRALFGHVTDFVALHLGRWYFPTFNAADAAITLGVALVLWTQFREEKSR